MKFIIKFRQQNLRDDECDNRIMETTVEAKDEAGAEAALAKNFGRCSIAFILKGCAA